MTKTDIPPGYYAVEIYDEDYKHVGWHLVEKTKRGKVKRSAQPTEGVDIETLVAALDFEREMYGVGRELDYLTDIELLRQSARETFGRLKGRCGCCGRTLTDPESKMRGIGPECWKEINQ